MTTDFELKLNTEHFIKSNEIKFVENEKETFSKKLDVSATGLRRSPDRSEVIDLK